MTSNILQNITRPKTYTVLDDCVYIQIEFDNDCYGFVDLNRFSPVVTQGCELLGTEGTILCSSESQNPYQTTPLAIYLEKDYNFLKIKKDKDQYLTENTNNNLEKKYRELKK